MPRRGNETYSVPGARQLSQRTPNLTARPAGSSLSAVSLTSPWSGAFGPSRPVTAAARRQIYEEALAIIAREYPADLQLDAVAARIFTSRRSLQRAFSEAGSSFRTEHLRTRLRIAAVSMRRNPDQTVAEVSRAVGYRQPAQFAKAFKREFGVSPAEYRDRGPRTALGRGVEARRHPRSASAGP